VANEYNSLEYWQATLQALEEEIASMLGAVQGQVGNLNIDSKATHDRLCSDRENAKRMINQLGGGTATTRNASSSAASHSIYES
jgi:hypothetical protein